METTCTAPPVEALPGDLIDEIVTFLRRFVVFQNQDHYLILALWIIHTHAFDAAYSTPYIYVRSAEPQSGKTRVCETAELLTRNAIKSDRMTPGALYAAIENRQPTLFLDELDAVFSGPANETLRGMLNSGYKTGGKVSVQVMGKGGVRDIEDYSTFCPKLLAGIDNGEVPATIADRCIVFDLKRKKRDETVERMNYRIVTPQAETLKERISHFAKANVETLADLSPADIDTISDRAFEISEPLIAIAMLFPGRTLPVRAAIERVFAARIAPETLTVKALRVARDLFADGDRDRITSAEFAAAMDIPSAPKASRILTPYGITTTTIKFGGGHIAKGYHRAAFVDAWERYLPTTSSSVSPAESINRNA